MPSSTVKRFWEIGLYDRWLSGIEPDPRDLLRPYPSELMRMWRISTRVNRPANNDPSVLDPEDDLFPAD